MKAAGKSEIQKIASKMHEIRFLFSAGNYDDDNNSSNDCDDTN